MKVKFLVVISLILMFFMGNSAFANSLDSFHQQLNDAYGHYRFSLSLTNKKNKLAPALKQVKAFDAKWTKLVKKYQSAPPAPYGESPLWNQTLKEVTKINKKALKELNNKQPKVAHETLEKTRTLLAALRKSVSIHVFSDYVDVYHHEMEVLVRRKYEKKKLDDATIITMREQLAVMTFLMNEAKANAPESYLKSKNFQKYIKGNVTLLKMLKQALEKKDEKKIKALLKKVKPAYGKLFVNFG